MAEVIHIAKPEAEYTSKRGFVMTESAQDILRSLQLVSGELGGALTMIAAAPGTGKTETLWHFRQHMKPSAIFHVAVAGEDDSPWGVACHLMETLEIGVPNNRNLRASRQSIAEEIGVDNVLLIDEAQNLIHRNLRGGTDWSTLEWLRAMAEEGCFSIVFSGDLAILEIAQRLPQLWRRMQRRVIIKAVSKADVSAFAEMRGISDVRIVEALYQVAKRGGGLGDVDSVIDHASLLAGRQRPAAPHVMAALEDLKLVPMGGK